MNGTLLYTIGCLFAGWHKWPHHRVYSFDGRVGVWKSSIESGKAKCAGRQVPHNALSKLVIVMMERVWVLLMEGCVSSVRNRVWLSTSNKVCSLAIHVFHHLFNISQRETCVEGGRARGRLGGRAGVPVGCERAGQQASGSQLAG